MPTQPWGGPPPMPAQAASPGAGAVTVGSLVGRTFSTWWAHVGKFSLLLVLAYVPIILAVAAAFASKAGGPSSREEILRASLPLLVIGGLATGVLVVAVYGGVIFGALQHLAGKPAAIGGMLGVGFRRWWILFLVSLGATLLITLGMMLLIVPGIIVALGLTASYPVAIAERVDGVGSALKRSFALTKGSRATLFGAAFVLVFATWLGSLVGSVTTAAAALGPVAAIGGLLLNLAIQVAMGSLIIVFSAVAYHDLRLAKEGVDTSQLAAVFE